MDKQILESIEGEFVFLKRHEEKTAQILFDSIQKDKERLSVFLPWPKYINSIQDELNWIQETNSEWENKTNFSFGIFRKSDNHFLGTIDIHNIHWKPMRCEIGYWILGDFEGKGHVSESVKILEKHIFGLGFNRIEIHCSSKNLRSANVPKSCGYLFDGVLKQDGFDNGSLRDTFVFSKLKENYFKDHISTKTVQDFKAVIDIAKKNKV